MKIFVNHNQFKKKLNLFYLYDLIAIFILKRNKLYTWSFIRHIYSFIFNLINKINL